MITTLCCCFLLVLATYYLPFAAEAAADALHEAQVRAPVQFWMLVLVLARH